MSSVAELKLGKIIVVDDEPNIVEVIRLYLEHASYEPVITYRGGEVIQLLRLHQPALVLLDVMLPDYSGFELCAHIRSEPGAIAQTPIIFLTAKGESIDKLRAFNLGVDDYIVKPFDPNELIARIKAVLRRTQSQSVAVSPQSESVKKTLRFGALMVDPAQYRVTLAGERMDLTPKEIELLHFLASNPGRVYSREDLLGYVWNFDFSGGTRTVDAHVKNLRKKLGASPDWSIQTLWGIGYSFEVPRHA
ncbi:MULTISPECIES: response regulator transcription factor [Paenibacillus]|uniref:Response regulator transcription factor n=1 Tax=Paenibacillus radicis (ex Xue et al. 2023) TaxID=2972489 RepID=A0ABT1YG69_9BACL|nr:response regulator transcription factor [Paenibacillus radicis (ex Xue et al. 2023)]MCR8631947.1 response regulator transcription factor [Paenibacillus radicis (ex Xue et al. 2023)]